MIIIKGNDIAINTRIGGGSFSDVHRISLNKAIQIGNRQLSKIVVKIPKENKWKVDEILSKIIAIKNSSLRTLNFAQKIILDYREVLLLEDLNDSDEIIFVSPNTRLVDHQQEELVHSLSQTVLGKQEPYVRQENSEAELFRYKNLLEEIIDFEKDIDVFLSEITNASNVNVILFTDCFFFSSSKISSVTKVDYKIADFDNINLNQSSSKTVRDNNQKEFVRSYWEFIKKYFKESQKKEYYLAYLDKKF